MTERIGGIVFIEAQDVERCEVCLRRAETRPYGPGGKNICFDCGQEDEDATKRRCAEFMTGLKLS